MRKKLTMMARVEIGMIIAYHHKSGEKLREYKQLLMNVCKQCLAENDHNGIKHRCNCDVQDCLDGIINALR